jgi:hypothetical protein
MDPFQDCHPSEYERLFMMGEHHPIARNPTQTQFRKQKVLAMPTRIGYICGLVEVEHE